MVYITGDKHRDFTELINFTIRNKVTKRDIIIVLGDVGVNYCLDESDTRVKRLLSMINATFIFLRGNHEERPENIPSYKKIHVDDSRFEADCFIEDDFPSLYFLDNGLLTLKSINKKCLVINGAYSVDKEIRLARGWNWFKDEELTDEEMADILEHAPEKVDYIFSHTCPEQFEPTEAYLPGLDRSTISKRMEQFLDKVEEQVGYKRWYCGHWHIDKKTDRLHFLFHDVERLV